MVILHSSLFLLHFPSGTVATVGFPDIGFRGFAHQGALRNSRASVASASGTWMRSMVAAE